MEKKGLGENMSLSANASGGVWGRIERELEGDERGDEPLEPGAGLEGPAKRSMLKYSSKEGL